MTFLTANLPPDDPHVVAVTARRMVLTATLFELGASVLHDAGVMTGADALPLLAYVPAVRISLGAYAARHRRIYDMERIAPFLILSGFCALGAGIGFRIAARNLTEAFSMGGPHAVLAAAFDHSMLGPATGGVYLAFKCARLLQKGFDVLKQLPPPPPRPKPPHNRPPPSGPRAA